jgi:hypothetical protein
MKTKIIYIDIDDTICRLKIAGNYESAYLIPKALRMVNSLYEEGHHIVFWTARGTVSGIDWRPLTERQLREWGFKYHELKMGKPAYDVFIDDKNVNSNHWLNE